ncbi:tRNA epoxyqueuosine(34) reductase QueG [filamentous cyanobacterium CCP5]|nr:tRNA epoxyqueuosine(34) reductase QueG [filamentous cyanobacterium CCP5]
MVLSRLSLVETAQKLGFHRLGIAAVPSTASPAETATTQALERWLEQGFHADMDWMANAKRQDVRKIMPGVRSLICVALNYYTSHSHPEGREYGKISRYGWGRDYHRVLHQKLKALTQWIQSQQPEAQVRYYADTGPISDKFWAQQAGLGWIAKNGCLITRDYGSWVFLGEILTDLDFPSDTPHTAHCGSCTRCLDACPTEAIRSPGVVDANRCIAYHTIENRDPQLPETIAKRLQGWVAGCDICQDVCPWNQRFAQPSDVVEFQPYPHNLAPTLSELSQISEVDWDQRFRASALRRIKPTMWRRNALAAQTSHSGQR